MTAGGFVQVTESLKNVVTQKSKCQTSLSASAVLIFYFSGLDADL